MTDREKLVELLDYIRYSQEFSCYDLYDMSDAAESIADFLISKGVTVREWRDAKTDPPKSGEHVLLCCEVRRSDGSSVKRYVCDGFYAAKHTEIVFYDGDDIACEYSEETDEYYLLEGWYEVIKNWNDYGNIVIADFVVGWQPLPEPLKEAPHE